MFVDDALESLQDCHTSNSRAFVLWNEDFFKWAVKNFWVNQWGYIKILIKVGLLRCSTIF